MSDLKTRTPLKTSKKILPFLISVIIIIGIGITYYSVNISSINGSEIAEAPLKKDVILPLIKKVNPNIYSMSVDSKQGSIAVYIKADKKAENNSSILIKTSDENAPLVEGLFENPNVKKVTVTVLKAVKNSQDDNRAVQFSFNKSQNIEVEELKKDLKKNYPNFYNLANKYYISPEIWRSLSGKDHMNFENRDRIK